MDMSIAADCYDVRAWAPVVPVIPDQEEKAHFGDKPFYIAVRIVPLESVVTFDPTEFAISVEGIDGPLMPIEIDDSLGDRNLQHPTRTIPDSGCTAGSDTIGCFSTSRSRTFIDIP